MSKTPHPANGPAVTMLDVARAAGVSVGTVSRVVNDNPSVKSALKAKVDAAIAELGFTPNPVAQSMRTSTTKAVGMILPNIAVPFFAQIVASAENSLYQEDYTLTLSSSGEIIERELEIIAFFRARRVDGLMATISDETSPALLRALKSFGKPVVLVQRKMPDRDCVVVDSYGGVRQALDYLHALGHRRIALTVGSETTHPGSQRAKAYRDFHAANALPLNPDWLQFCGLSTLEAYQRVMALFNARTPPTALIAGSFQMIGALKALRSLGVSVPERVSLISLGETELTELLAGGISSVRWDNAEVGRVAARLLLEAIREERSDPIHITLPVEFVLRSSCSRPAD